MSAELRVVGALESQSVAVARARLYRLLGNLIAGRGQAVASARSIPELSELFAGASTDDLLVAHHTRFSMQVFPIESVYFDRDILVGGPAAERVASRYTEAGFHPPTEDTVDHLGVQLRFLGYLCGARAEELQGQFLGDMFAWLPCFALAMRAMPQDPWSRVVETVLDVLVEHADSLEVTATQPGLAEQEDPLARKSTGLRGIARYLCAPARSGAFFARDQMSEWSSLPRGFGSRVQVLGNLLTNAAEYGTTAQLASQLASALTSRAAAYRSLAASSHIWSAALLWAQRCDHSASVCCDLAEAASSLTT